MTVGEGFGACFIMHFSQPMAFNTLLTKYFGKPVNVRNAWTELGVMLYVPTLNNKATGIIRSVCDRMFSVYFHSFQTILIGICAAGEIFS